jgi:large subunit ribosomal protein L9
MAKTEVILLQQIIGLGAESDQVKVAAGYARNYLFPQRLAIPLSAGNKKQIEALRIRRAAREAHELNTMNEVAKSLAKLTCLIKVKTGDDGKMFGSVTSGTIADELQQQFDISLDKRKIHLEAPIRALGEYDVECRLHPGVVATLKLHVESTTPPPAPPEGAEARGKEGKEPPRGKGREGEAPARPDRRGHRPDGKPPGPADKAARPDRGPRPARPVRPPRPDRPPRTEKPVKAEKPPKPETPQ